MANSELNKKKKKNSYKKTSNKTSKSRSKKKNTKKNYPYSRSKKTQNTKTQNAKKRITKLDNNVSIKVDDKLEKLNYSILDENVNNDYKKNKVQSSRKIKTDFKDDIDVETLKDEKLEVVIEDIPNDVINFDDETPAEIEEKEELETVDADVQIDEELDSFITNNEDTEEINKLIEAIDIDEDEVEKLEDDDLEEKDSESIDDNDQEKEEKAEIVEENHSEEKEEKTETVEENHSEEDSKSIAEIDAEEVNKLIDEIDKTDEEEEPEVEIAELLESEDISEDELEVLDTTSSDEELTEELDEVTEDITEEKEKGKEENNVIRIPLDLVKKYEESLEDVLEEEPIIKDNGEILTEESDETDTEDVDVLSIESDEDHSGVDESTSERIEAEDVHNVSMTENKEDILESTKIIEDSFDDSKERAKEIYSHLEDEEVSFVNNEDKGYRRFILRLIILILILLLSIFFIINFSIKYINDSNVKDVNYYESSSIKYTLCTQGNCVEDTEIHGYNDSVSATFGYKSKFDEDISYNMNYSIVSLFEIVDPESKDVVFKDEENVLTKEIEAVKTDELKFSQDVDFSLTKFREDLSKYNEGKDKTYLGYVKLIMYTSGINDKKQVALLNIPLQDDLLKKKVVSYNTGDATVTISNKNDSGVIYVCLMIISLSIVIGSCIGLPVLLNTSSDDED